ncbi:unnamed protein product [Cylicocyclus nassatus]|uniref:Uncharacterized protein n=1 Tax=Cylicocyclus nassatus TaxID=53992 RepID=A0AA36GJP2_CYLNA|nr:unnamed protein product [Cylicocyclus nassatus]
MDDLMQNNRELITDVRKLSEEVIMLEAENQRAKDIINRRSSSSTNPKGDMAPINGNIWDEMETKRSLVFAGVPESRGGSSSYRTNHDLACVGQVLGFLIIDCRPVTVYRMGRPSPSRDRWLTLVLKEVLKRLPLNIPALVNASPLKSSDGVLYAGSKKDVWLEIDALTGAKVETMSATNDKVCPANNKSAVFVGRAEYRFLPSHNNAKQDAVLNSLCFNFYSSFKFTTSLEQSISREITMCSMIDFGASESVFRHEVKECVNKVEQCDYLVRQ